MGENDRSNGRPEPEEPRDRVDETPITIDIETLLEIVDLRPDALSLAAESEWAERHLGAARRALRADFDPKSLAIFECLLSGERVSHVAARFGTSDQSVYKIKQRVSKRLAEIVLRSIAIEERGESAAGDAGPGAKD